MAFSRPLPPRRPSNSGLTNILGSTRKSPITTHASSRGGHVGNEFVKRPNSRFAARPRWFKNPGGKFKDELIARHEARRTRGRSLATKPLAKTLHRIRPSPGNSKSGWSSSSNTKTNAFMPISRSSVDAAAFGSPDFGNTVTMREGLTGRCLSLPRASET